ncbi:MAG: hypothetical protein R6V40_01825, partial [Candidatus Moraniibacteriota bacterium]
RPQSLLHWSFFGPLMLFFLWVAFVLIESISTSVFGNMDIFKNAFDLEKLGSGNTLSGFTQSISAMIIPYIVAIFLLFYGFRFSQSVSEGAAKGVLTWGDKKIAGWSKKASGVARDKLTGGSLRDAAKDRFEDKTKNKTGFKWMTEKGRQGAKEEQKAKWKKRMGDASALNDLKIKNANEKIKNWKDNPPDVNKLKNDLAQDKADLATVMYLSQNDELGIHKDESGNKHNLYKKAMEMGAVKEQGGLKKKIEKEVKKKNGAAVFDHELSRFQASNPETMDNVAKRRVMEDNFGDAPLKDILNQKDDFFLDDNGNLKNEARELLVNKTQGLNANTKEKFAADIGNRKVREALRREQIL